MKLQKLGKNTSVIEVQNISNVGIWLFVGGKEYFLPYKEYPWFKKATVEQIYDVELLRGKHIAWPSLDVELELESLENPEKYPLVYRAD